jgi:hypothetical protein
MRGFIFRLGVSIKNAGENSKSFFCGAVIRLGLSIRDFARSVGKK